MRKIYLNFLPVHSEEIADLLRNECVWEVMREVRQSGTEGITADMISTNLHESPSTIYAALKQLERVGFIQGMKLRKWLKFWGRPSNETKGRVDSGGKPLFKKAGKSPKIYFEPCEKSAARSSEKENPWGDVIFDEKFANDIGRIIRKNKGLGAIRKEFIRFIEDIYTDIERTKDEDMKKIAPDASDLCKVCKKSHELREFIKAIVLFSAADMLDSKEMENFIRSYETRAESAQATKTEVGA